MYLINCRTLQLEKFLEEKPRYAILSHTWGDEEVTYHDMSTNHMYRMQGWYKIAKTCEEALANGCNYAWVDTCCIDSSSSAGLSEAINSMFKWYEDAAICYAYLSDLFDTSEHSLVRSRWWTRGWTLQELLAPADVVFYNSTWEKVGTKLELCNSIEQATLIPVDILDKSCGLTGYNALTKMLWASHRKTTRIEDEAYCLLGLFDVNIPLIYGEGRKAFYRLQEEILRKDGDLSILACNPISVVKGFCAKLLADSPSQFRDIIPHVSESGWDRCGDVSIINNHLRIAGSLPLNVIVRREDGQEIVHYALRLRHCSRHRMNQIYIPLRKLAHNVYLRDDENIIQSAPEGTVPKMIGYKVAETRIVMRPAHDSQRILTGNIMGGIKLSWPGECVSNLIYARPRVSYDYAHQTFLQVTQSSSPDNVATAELKIDLNAAGVGNWKSRWVNVIVIFPVTDLAIDKTLLEKVLIYERGSHPHVTAFFVSGPNDKNSVSWFKMQQVCGASLMLGLSNKLILRNWKRQSLCIEAHIERLCLTDVGRTKQQHATLRVSVSRTSFVTSVAHMLTQWWPQLSHVALLVVSFVVGLLLQVLYFWFWGNR